MLCWLAQNRLIFLFSLFVILFFFCLLVSISGTITLVRGKDLKIIYIFIIKVKPSGHLDLRLTKACTRNWVNANTISWLKQRRKHIGGMYFYFCRVKKRESSMKTKANLEKRINNSFWSWAEKGLASSLSHNPGNKIKIFYYTFSLSLLFIAICLSFLPNECTLHLNVVCLLALNPFA